MRVCVGVHQSWGVTPPRRGTGIARSPPVPRATKGKDQDLASFPRDYDELISMAQSATSAALENGFNLVEVEFPPTSLGAVCGDGEGANEMTYSMGFLRSFVAMFNRYGIKFVERSNGIRMNSSSNFFLLLLLLLSSSGKRNQPASSSRTNRNSKWPRWEKARTLTPDRGTLMRSSTM